MNDEERTQIIQKLEDLAQKTDELWIAARDLAVGYPGIWGNHQHKEIIRTLIGSHDRIIDLSVLIRIHPEIDWTQPGRDLELYCINCGAFQGETSEEKRQRRGIIGYGHDIPFEITRTSRGPLCQFCERKAGIRNDFDTYTGAALPRKKINFEEKQPWDLEENNA